jgi:hypothetical protein
MEFGTVSNGYIRSEDRLYFNFAKGDIWDVYFALEFDDAVQSRTADRIRQTQGDESSFGVERLNASVKLPWIWSRLNAGWDVYAVDLDAGSIVYGDDDPGFSIQGGVANFDWKFGYHKKIEVNRRVTSADRVAANNITNTGYDNDRDVYSARVNFTLFKDTKFGLIYAFNDQKVRGNVATNDVCGLLGPAPANNTCQNVNANFISPIVTASIAGFKIAAQFSHSFGDAERMLVAGDKFDIDSNAAFADIAYDMTRRSASASSRTSACFGRRATITRVIISWRATPALRVSTSFSHRLAARTRSWPAAMRWSGRPFTVSFRTSGEIRMQPLGPEASVGPAEAITRACC